MRSGGDAVTHSAKQSRLALIIRGHAYRRRAPRADVDFALAAAAMDFDLELYFLGNSLLQLAVERDGRAALLPGGYRAWSALPEMAAAEWYAERQWLERCERSGIQLTLPVQARTAAEMRAGWQRCRHVLLL
jgi:hypothetical protein